MNPTQLKIDGQPFELPGIVADQAFRRVGGSKGCNRSRLTDIAKGLRIKAKDIWMAEHFFFELPVVGIDMRLESFQDCVQGGMGKFSFDISDRFLIEVIANRIGPPQSA